MSTGDDDFDSGAKFKSETFRWGSELVEKSGPEKLNLQIIDMEKESLIPCENELWANTWRWSGRNRE